MSKLLMLFAVIFSTVFKSKLIETEIVSSFLYSLCRNLIIFSLPVSKQPHKPSSALKANIFIYLENPGFLGRKVVLLDPSH